MAMYFLMRFSVGRANERTTTKAYQLRRGGRRHEIAPRYCYRHVCGVSDGASRHGRGVAVLEEKEINLTPEGSSVCTLRWS